MKVTCSSFEATSASSICCTSGFHVTPKVCRRGKGRGDEGEREGEGEGEGKGEGEGEGEPCEAT